MGCIPKGGMVCASLLRNDSAKNSVRITFLQRLSSRKQKRPQLTIPTYYLWRRAQGLLLSTVRLNDKFTISNPEGEAYFVEYSFRLFLYLSNSSFPAQSLWNTRSSFSLISALSSSTFITIVARVSSRSLTINLHVPSIGHGSSNRIGIADSVKLIDRRYGSVTALPSLQHILS